MALSASDKQRVLNMLDELEQNELEKIIASLTAFGNWLSSVAYSIYCKIKDVLSNVWKAVCNVFQ